MGGKVGFQDATVFDKAGLEKAGKSDVQESASASPLCPECNSQKLFKDGLRLLKDSSKVQRWLCRKCGYRFSNQPPKNSLKWQLNTPSSLTFRRRICEENSKNLTATETKTVAGVKEANLIEYAWQKKKKGVGDGTIRTNCSWLSKLIAKGAEPQ